MLHVKITDSKGNTIICKEEPEDTSLFIKELRKETEKIMAKLSEQVIQLNTINEEQKVAMAELRQVVSDEAMEIGDKVDALEAQIAQLREELETATGDNPTLAAIITDMESNVADLRTSAANVEALSEEEEEVPEEPTEPAPPVEETPEVPVEEDNTTSAPVVPTDENGFVKA